MNKINIEKFIPLHRGKRLFRGSSFARAASNLRTEWNYI